MELGGTGMTLEDNEGVRDRWFRRIRARAHSREPDGLPLPAGGCLGRSLGINFLWAGEGCGPVGNVGAARDTAGEGLNHL